MAYILSRYDVEAPGDAEFSIDMPGTPIFPRVVDTGSGFSILVFVEEGEPEAAQQFKFLALGDELPWNFRKICGSVTRNGELQILAAAGMQM